MSGPVSAQENLSHAGVMARPGVHGINYAQFAVDGLSGVLS